MTWYLIGVHFHLDSLTLKAGNVLFIQRLPSFGRVEIEKTTGKFPAAHQVVIRRSLRRRLRWSGRRLSPYSRAKMDDVVSLIRKRPSAK